jgi:phosphate transport system substrate-binding protein
MQTRLSTFFAVALLSLAFCSSSYAAALDAFKGEKSEIKIAGGTTRIPVIKEAAARIMGLNPDIQISIAGGGCGVGIK